MLTDKIEIYFDSFASREREVLGTFHQIIMESDPHVKCIVARVMSIEQALVYQEQDVFKYALAKTKNHFTLHNMIMYAYPELADFLRGQLNGAHNIKFQKGCINFKNAVDFPVEAFGKFIKKSAQMDFSKIISRYKKI